MAIPNSQVAGENRRTVQSAKLLPMRTLLVATLLSLFLCSTGVAQPAAVHAASSGEELLQKCKGIGSKPTGYDDGFCAGFITGTIDTLHMWIASDIFAKRTHDEDVKFCFPDNVDNRQILLVFIKYLEEHPEELHKPANLLFVEAMRKVFPCPANKLF
jgi:Rap1a immunity proteins